jgi:hypothetical protein
VRLEPQAWGSAAAQVPSIPRTRSLATELKRALLLRKPRPAPRGSIFIAQAREQPCLGAADVGREVLGSGSRLADLRFWLCKGVPGSVR